MNLEEIRLPIHHAFPDNLTPDETGLVALGGSLSVPLLLEAYSRGIFPWAGTDPIPWFSPDPRLVLIPEEFHLSRRLKRKLRQTPYEVRFDNDFSRVITTCSRIRRKQQQGTWIDAHIIQAYTELFQLHIAHCIEVLVDGVLQGGLYGLSLGKTFFGESMFSCFPDGSKVALYYLTRKLCATGLHLIDCQQSTPHMISLGAKEISRARFLEHLHESMQAGINLQYWTEST